MVIFTLSFTVSGSGPAPFSTAGASVIDQDELPEDNPSAKRTPHFGPETLAVVTPSGAPPPRLLSPADHWHQAETRWFFATALDIGFLYLRPRASLGYGRPHSRWLGLDLNPILSFEGIGAWAGLRAALPYINIRVGARYQFAFRRSLLAPKERYERVDIEDRDGPRSTYVSLESELTLDMPLGGGKVVGELAGTAVLAVDQGRMVYEETLRVVVDPPWVWRLRLGYTAPLDRRRVFWVGGVTEIVHVPLRDAATVRGGFIARLKLFANLEARATLLPVWYGHDSLGAAGSDVFLIGLRYRWATGVPLIQ